MVTGCSVFTGFGGGGLLVTMVLGVGFNVSIGRVGGGVGVWVLIRAWVLFVLGFGLGIQSWVFCRLLWLCALLLVGYGALVVGWT